MEYERIFLTSAQIALGSTGDKATFTIPVKMEWYRSQLVIESTSSHATQAVVKFDKRPTAGSDTGRGDGDCGVITKPASNVQGKVIYDEPASTESVMLDEGDQVVVEVTTANGDACNAVAQLIGRVIPESKANNAAMQATA
ncbi:MAG TPA: hypothetical protein VEA38_26180 [Terriglobales bacterium]|nr:hypothetical protein [Terriglobales bacterium]